MSNNFFYRNLHKRYPQIRSACGVWVTDADGCQYLDGCSGAIVCNIGHGVGEVNEAIRRQLQQVAFAHTSQFVSESALELAEEIVNLTSKLFSNQGRSSARVYFTSGGSESVETALKMARAYFVERGQGSRRFVISRVPSYHGSTFGALAATGHPARRKPYEPLLFSINQGNSLQPLSGDSLKIPTPYPYRCSCGTGVSCASENCGRRYAALLEESIQNLGPENVMAFIGEPVVGAALGAASPHDGYWRAIRQTCTKYGVLMISDEVMTGLGRVGANFGMDLWNVTPDIVALGKGLSAGYLPLGAVVAAPNVVESFERGSGVFEHGFTYSGHPTSCAAGLAVLRYMKEHRLVERVQQQESDFFARLNELRELPIVGDVRGRGFLAGLELVRDKANKEPFPAIERVSARVAEKSRSLGLLVYPGSAFMENGCGDHVMIAPPFSTTAAEMDLLFQRLRQALGLVSEELLTATTGTVCRL